MATNLFEHPSIIASEALSHLEDALIITKLCAVDKTSDFTNRANGWKVGDTVSFRTHGEYDVDEFSSTINTQAISSSTRAMTIEKHYDVSVQLTAHELALDLDDLTAQVLQPAAYKLAEKVNTYVASKIAQGAGLYASDNLLTTAADIALARKAANYQQLSTNRFCLVDQTVEALLLGETWFNQAATRGIPGVTTLQTGVMGTVMGMDWYSAFGFPTSTATVGNGTTTTSATPADNQIGDTALTVASTSATFKAGDRITVAGMRRPLRVKTQTEATATSIPLVDPITEIVPVSAAVAVIGSGQALTYEGAIFDDRSLGVAFPMLDMPDGASGAIASNNGINIRVVKQYNISTKVTTMSMDMLVGAFCLDPRRITLLANY